MPFWQYCISCLGRVRIAHLSLSGILNDFRLSTDERAEQARQLLQLTQRDSIYLYGCNIDYYGYVALAQAIPQCPLVRILFLNQDDFSKGSAALGKAIPHCPSLKSVHLGGNSSNKAIVLIKDDINHPFLRAILIGSDTRVENFSSLMRVIPYCPLLTCISFTSSDIDDERCEALAKVVVHCSLLTSIKLSNNIIGCKGCAALALAIPQCRSLETVDLYSNNIGAEGCISLANAILRSRSLISLIVDPSNIGVECQEALGIIFSTQTRNKEAIIKWARRRSFILLVEAWLVLTADHSCLPLSFSSASEGSSAVAEVKRRDADRLKQLLLLVRGFLPQLPEPIPVSTRDLLSSVLAQAGLVRNIAAFI